MRRLAAITFGAVLAFGVLGLSNQAQAANISSASQYFIVDGGAASVLKLTNYESAFTDAWSDDPSTWSATTTIAEGDYLRGIFTITSSNIPGGGGATIRTSDGSFELTGVFSAKVNKITNDDAGTSSLFELTPDSAFEGEYGAGAMAAFFSDTTVNFTGGGSSLADSYNSAAGGSSFMVLGAPSGGTWGTDYYWAAVGSTTPSVSQFAASLALLTNNTGLPTSDFLTLTQQQPTHSTSTGAYTSESALNSILNVFALQGNTNFNTVSPSPWQIESQDPLKAIVVPLPAASWLGAVMLLGMLGFGIRKSRRREAF